MRSSEVLSPSVHAGHGDPGSEPTIYRAVVKDVDTGALKITCTVPHYSRTYDYKDVEYMPREGDTMTTDSQARVAFDDERHPFVVWWKP